MSLKGLLHVIEALLDMKVLVKQGDNFRTAKLTISPVYGNTGRLTELVYKIDICR